MSVIFDKGSWVRGPVEWVEGNTVHLSIVFTWHLNESLERATKYRDQGYNVVVGGPGVFTRKKYFDGVATIGTELPDTVVRHNPMATIASRGCPVGCWFCIVPKMEGKDFTLLPDFPVRPVLCDNNLSALSAEYQDHIVARYVKEDVPLLDANSGFEPRTFDEEVYRRWVRINKGVWRFAYDDAAERSYVERVMRMLRHLPPRKKQVYTMIGNEPFAACMQRISEVISWGGEPYAQPFIKLNALEKKPNVRFDWTDLRLRQVQRYVNRRIWRYALFDQYDASVKSNRTT